MNLDDLNKESLGLQKIPFPVIESIVLNDDDGISLDMRWSIYAPVTNGKDPFESYRDFITISAVIMTRDVTEETNKALENSKIKAKGAFLDLGQMSLPTSFEVYGGFYWLNNQLLESNRFGSPYSFNPDTAVMISSPEFGQIRKYQFSQTFKDLKMTEVIDPKKPPSASNNIRVLADDRIINLSGFIEITADLTKVSLPFPTKASKLTYAFPFTIAQEGEIGFSYLAVQTNQQEIWAGPIDTQVEESGEILVKKLPLRLEDPNLQFVNVEDPTVVSSFVGVKTGGYFQLDLDQGPLSVQGAFDKLGNQLLWSRKFANSFGDYFSSKKLDKINSPVSPVWCWGTNKKNSVNLAFEFDIKKFMNGDAFQYSGMGINVYEDNLKSLTILRTKIAKNIDERFTQDFLEKEVATIPDFIIKQAIFDGAAYFTDKKINYTVYRDDRQTGGIRLLITARDNTVEDSYSYKYSLRVVYDSKRLTALNEYFDTILPVLAKFESLESVIFLSQFYDSDYDRMTDKFKMQYKKLFDDLASALKLYYQYLGAVVKPLKSKELTAEQIFADLYDATVKTILTLIDVDTILPSTYFILKDVLRESVEQGRKFLRDPSLNKKPKNKDSKPPKAPEKIYELSGEVKVEGYNNVSLNYLEKGKPTQFNTAPEITMPQLQNLFELEYAKYHGESQTLTTVNSFDNISFTPVTLNYNNKVFETLDEANLFNPPENQDLASLILSMASDGEVDYVQNTAKENPAPLLQQLLSSNISIIDSSNRNKFLNTKDQSKMSFTDYFSQGDPFNKQDKPKKFYVKKKNNYQNLQPLVSQYGLMTLIGLKKFKEVLKSVTPTTSDKAVAVDSWTPAQHVLKIDMPTDTAPPYVIDLQQKLISALNGDPINQESFEKIIFAIMVLTNNVVIETLQDKGWTPLTSLDFNQNLGGTYVLSRFVFLKDELRENLTQFGASIINQYFVLDLGNSTKFVKAFSIPNNKNPEKPAVVIVPKVEETLDITPTPLPVVEKVNFSNLELERIDTSLTAATQQQEPVVITRQASEAAPITRTTTVSSGREVSPSSVSATARIANRKTKKKPVAATAQTGRATGSKKLEETKAKRNPDLTPPPKNDRNTASASKPKKKNNRKTNQSYKPAKSFPPRKKKKKSSSR